MVDKIVRFKLCWLESFISRPLFLKSLVIRFVKYCFSRCSLVRLRNTEIFRSLIFVPKQLASLVAVAELNAFWSEATRDPKLSSARLSELILIRVVISRNLKLNIFISFLSLVQIHKSSH